MDPFDLRPIREHEHEQEEDVDPFEPEVHMDYSHGQSVGAMSPTPSELELGMGMSRSRSMQDRSGSLGYLGAGGGFGGSSRGGGVGGGVGGRREHSVDRDSLSDDEARRLEERRMSTGASQSMGMGMGMSMSQSVRGLDASHRVDSMVGSIHESQLFPMGSDLF